MIYDELKSDHMEVLALFGELSMTAEKDVQSCDRLFMRLRSKLHRLRRAEETVFYPVLRQRAEALVLVEGSILDHHEIEQMLDRLEKTERGGADWAAAVLELKENVEQHILEEETRLFERARAVLSDREACELGRKYGLEKSKAA